MNTDIIKGRTTSIELVNGFSQKLNIYDVVIYYSTGMNYSIITKIDDNKIIHLWQSNKRFLAKDLILATGILPIEKIKKIQNDYFSTVKAIEQANLERVRFKVIKGIWHNKNTKRIGQFFIPISSKIGKSVVKSDVNHAISQFIDFQNKYPNYEFRYNIENNTSYYTGNIHAAHIYPEREYYSCLQNFDVESLSAYAEDPLTLEDKLISLNSTNPQLIILDTATNLSAKLSSTYACLNSSTSKILTSVYVFQKNAKECAFYANSKRFTRESILKEF